MKVNVELKRIDVLENEESIVASGKAILENDTLKYKESQEDAIHIVKFTDECITLERKSDVSSYTTLYFNKKGETIVKSLYGDMKMVSKLHTCKKSAKKWEIEYSLYLREEEISRQKLIWTMKCE